MYVFLPLKCKFVVQRSFVFRNDSISSVNFVVATFWHLNFMPFETLVDEIDLKLKFVALGVLRFFCRCAMVSVLCTQSIDVDSSRETNALAGSCSYSSRSNTI